MIIDTHCHLNDKKITNVNQIIENFDQDNIKLAICNSSNIKDCQELITMSTDNANIYCTLGVHPHDAASYNQQAIDYIIANANHPKVVAIGEIGLDYYYDFCDRETQRQVMASQIDLAYNLQLPMVFHIRDAMGDFLEYVRANKDKFKYGAEVHSFSGSLEVAKELISYGFYLGFNGIITFKNANKILDVIKNIPLQNILIETDAPYLTPEPHRGKVNEPKYTHFVAQKIAELKNIDIEQVHKITTDNACMLFKKLRID